MQTNKKVAQNWLINWHEKLQFILTFIGVVSSVGTFIAYYIINSYLNDIQFSTDSIPIHLIVSIVTHIVVFFTVLFIALMFGSFFSYSELHKIENHSIVKKLWLSSLVTLILLYFSYFIGAYFFVQKKWLDFYLLLLILLLPVLVYFFVRRTIPIKNSILVFWQIYYSVFIVAILLLLSINERIEWADIIFIIIGTLSIHSYPYLFILISEKSWLRYATFSLILFSAILLITGPNILKKASIKFSRIGGVHYKTITVNDKECAYLNKYFSNKPCNNNQLRNLKGLWLQGEIYLFEDKNLTRYKIHRDNII